jgi:hypothetical protein
VPYYDDVPAPLSTKRGARRPLHWQVLRDLAHAIWRFQSERSDKSHVPRPGNRRFAQWQTFYDGPRASRRRAKHAGGDRGRRAVAVTPGVHCDVQHSRDRAPGLAAVGRPTSAGRTQVRKELRYGESARCLYADARGVEGAP